MSKNIVDFSDNEASAESVHSAELDQLNEISELSESQLSDQSVEPVMNIYTGLVLNDDYVLLNKIGSGNNASVWLSYRITLKKYFAIKIQDNECYNDGKREVAIIKKINEWCANNQSKKINCVTMLDFFVYIVDKDTKFVCSVYELYAGSIYMLIHNGVHKYGLPLNVVKKAIKQLLSTLAIIHDELNIIHTDIKPENILIKGQYEIHKIIIDTWKNTKFHDRYEKLTQLGLDPEEFSEELSQLAKSCTEDIRKLGFSCTTNETFCPDDEEDDDGHIYGSDDSYDYDDSNYNSDDIPNEYSCDGEYNNDDEDYDEKENIRNQSVDDTIEQKDNQELVDLDDESVCCYDFNRILNNKQNSKDQDHVIDDSFVYECETALTDFGCSYFYDKRTKDEIQDRRYRAPEILLDFNYGYACDIWSVACLAFELATGFVLFAPDDQPLNRDIHHLYLMEKNLGPLPTSMKKRSIRKKFLFDKKRNYHIKNIEEFQLYPLRDRLVSQFLLSEKDADEFWNFLKCGFVYNPRKRHTAKELLAHSWLKNISID